MPSAKGSDMVSIAEHTPPLVTRTGRQQVRDEHLLDIFARNRMVYPFYVCAGMLRLRKAMQLTVCDNITQALQVPRDT